MPQNRPAMRTWNAFVRALPNKNRPKAAGGKRAPISRNAAETAPERVAYS
jgi:hypothetical protein